MSFKRRPSTGFQCNTMSGDDHSNPCKRSAVGQFAGHWLCGMHLRKAEREDYCVVYSTALILGNPRTGKIERYYR